MCVVRDACFVCFHAMSTLEPFVLRVSIHNSLFVCCSWHNTHALDSFSRCYHAQRIQRAHIVVICPLTTSGCSSYMANFNHVHLRKMQRFTSQRHYVSDMPNHMSKSECNAEIVGESINTHFSSYIALNILAVFASAFSPAVRANTAAPAVFANSSSFAVRANTAAPAVFAFASSPAVRANTAAPAVFAFASLSAVRANTAAPAVFA